MESRVKNHVTMLMAATAGWMLTLLVMVDATADRSRFVAFWGVIFAFMASVPTYWLILVHLHKSTRDLIFEALHAERVRTEELVLAVACEFAQAELPRLDARRSNGA